MRQNPHRNPALFSLEEDVPWVLQDEDRDEEVAVCAIEDPLDATAVGDTEADDGSVVEGKVASD